MFYRLCRSCTGGRAPLYRRIEGETTVGEGRAAYMCVRNGLGARLNIEIVFAGGRGCLAEVPPGSDVWRAERCRRSSGKFRRYGAGLISLAVFPFCFENKIFIKYFKVK